MVVRPETLLRWHRSAWKLLWRVKSRPGRPAILPQLQGLIRRMATENPRWGEERIANELLLKLGIKVSPRTVRKYMPRRPRGRPRGDLRWSTFLRLHAQGMLVCDFCLAITASFRMLYVFVVIERASRRLANCNVTARPTAAWTLQQLRSLLRAWTRHSNRGRPHMALGPGIADPPASTFPNSDSRHRRRESYSGHVDSILGGLQHEYRLIVA